MKNIEIYANFKIREKNYNNHKYNIDLLETKLAILMSQVKKTNITSIKVDLSNNKKDQADILEKKRLIISKLELERESIVYCEKLLKQSIEQILFIKNKYDENTDIHSLDRNYFYLFYYRHFVYIKWTVEQIAIFLGITSDYARKLKTDLEKDLDIFIEKIKNNT